MLTQNDLKNFQKGKKKAFDKVYTAYAGGMYVVAKRYVFDNDTAQEIVQDSFIKIYENRASFNVEKPIGAWIKTITINTAISYIRKNARFVHVEDDAQFETEVIFEEVNNEEERKQLLMKALETLPTGYRTVFNLYVLDNLTHKEIAEYLDISVNTSKSQLFKAKNMLKTLLQGQMEQAE